MGGTLRLHEEPPRGDAPVYAHFGDARADDWSGEGHDGCEQELSIIVRARPGSAALALAAADRMAELIHDASPPLEGHRLVNLRVRACEIARDERSGFARATLRVRAVTERL
ncbi:MAG: DUF3168 domain-containing protein [Salinarimonadaceae bacterium]|nr:MAG: DUF3168 domain-containing protein [Salinarimonadaceae bacterium]